MEHLECSTRIFYSTSYGKFKFLKGNRDINETKVAKIIEDIKKGIDILGYSPIIVNSNMEIIDGQHRFAVSQKLKCNVYYVIKEDADLATVPAINSKGSKWRNVDFLNSYIDLKKEVYLDVKKFRLQYPRVGIPVAINLFHTGQPGTTPETVEDFQNGVLRNTHREKAFSFAAIMKEFEPFTDNPYSRRFFTAIMKLWDNGKYDHKLMLKKLQISGRRIENIDSTKSITEEMESIINHKSRERISIM